MKKTTPTPRSATARHPVVRVVLAIAGVFTAWHVFASFLWISPPSELRTLVPGNLLSSYMLPWFGQSWSVFAPEPINGDYRFAVRATIRTGTDEAGEPTYKVTRWVDATEAELNMSRYNLFPPRAAGLATHQSSLLLNNWKKLTAEQQEIAALGYFKGDDWLGRMHEAMDAHGNKGAVVDYIVQERYSDAYATQVARAVWGEDKVAQVQYEVSRQNVVPFAQRNDPDAQRPKPEIAATGWRGLIVMPGQSADAFQQTFHAPLNETEDE